MTLTRGRIVRAGEAGARVAKRAGAAGAPPSPQGRVMKKPAVDARAEARRILAEAERQAERVLDQAGRAAGEIKAAAERAGRDEGAHRFAAALLRLRAEQAERDRRDLVRAVDLARAMAERLIGESLALDPSRITAIAKQALSTVRRVRSVAIFAHPDDASALERDIERLGLEGAAVEIHADEARPRGSLLLRTDLGTLDADLSLQLDRLAAALRESFAED
jgi:flagellar biosynthesis/type III secretory pathway protein FliH